MAVLTEGRRTCSVFVAKDNSVFVAKNNPVSVAKYNYVFVAIYNSEFVEKYRPFPSFVAIIFDNSQCKFCVLC